MTVELEKLVDEKIENIEKKLMDATIESEDEEVVDANGTDADGAKKKKKKKKPKKKTGGKQTDPPTISVSDLFPNDSYPVGEIQHYVEEYVLPRRLM
jgi:methionyl aminopeptidase